ncbi:MAG: hypothetical protein ABWY45_18835 [Mycobacterium sp.]
MSSKRWGWTRHLAVLGGFEMIFAAVASIGIFLTAAGLGYISGAVAIGLTAVALFIIGALLLRRTSRNNDGGGVLDRRHNKIRQRVYRAQYRGRPNS